MIRCLFLYFIVFLTFGHEALSSKSDLSTYNVQDAIDDISLFIPGSKLVLTTALKLARVYGEIRHYIDPNSTQIMESLDKLNDKVDGLSTQLSGMADQLNSISEDVKDVKEILVVQVLDGLPKEIHLDSQMKSIYDKINGLNSLFNKFLEHTGNDEHEKSSLLEFANDIIHTTGGIEYSILRPIHYDITEKYSRKNILTVLADQRISFMMMCTNNPPASSAERIVHLYHDIMLAEVKGVILTEYAYSIKKMFEKNPTYKTELELARVNSYNRTISTIIDVKRALYKAPRDFWACQSSQHVEGETYSKLGPIFQAYFLYESDIGDKKYSKSKFTKCAGNCSNRQGSFPDICISKQCSETYKKPCMGLLHNCKEADKEIKFCAADDNKHKRYEYAEFVKKNEVLGTKKRCKPGHEFRYHKKTKLVNDCDVCVCTCENAPSKMNRYFSLKSVTSDIKSNKIVTGIRLREQNNIFHIQIQQGQLQKDGNVAKDTVEWKPIDEYTVYDKNIIAGRDYHNITYSNRTVLLDNIDSPKNNVLTGLRFQLQESNLKLEIQATPFNFNSGELKEKESKWLSNSISFDERSELSVENRDVLPSSTSVNNRDSDNNQYIQFTTSSLKADVGQTVVPFIDLQEISSNPPLPLSGAGLIHKGNQNSAGFLGIKLYTYNFAPHLHA